LKSKLNQRLSRLEEKMQPDIADTILHFADGTMASIPGGEHSVQLLGYTFGAQRVPDEAVRELELIRRSVASEAGRGLARGTHSRLAAQPRDEPTIRSWTWRRKRSGVIPTFTRRVGSTRAQ
jgi:hypothetical protein